MSTWTFADIKKKIRQVTGRLSSMELSDDELLDRVNKFYQYTFPAEVKLDRNHTYYEFVTTTNEPYYDSPDMFTNFEPPATLDSQLIEWFQDPAEFFACNPMSVVTSVPWVGDGITAIFATTIASPLIYPGTTVITDNTETFVDTNKTWANSPVIITGTLGGVATITYNGGVIVANFMTAPDSGQNIYLSYTGFTAGKPRSVLYYNNQFQFSTVPDTAYRFRVKAYTKLAPFTLSTDRPLLDQWGPCIAYGTARDLHVDYGETDAYAEVTALYKEQISYVMNRTSQNLLNVRAKPSF